MNEEKVALVTGDGSGPEMMAVACAIAIEAAKKTALKLFLKKLQWGGTLTKSMAIRFQRSLSRRQWRSARSFLAESAIPNSTTLSVLKKPDMKPEARCLLALRKHMGLLLNFRPMVYYKELAHLANVKPETIPDTGVQQVWIRYLLEDSYFGNEDLMLDLRPDDCETIGVKLKSKSLATRSSSPIWLTSARVQSRNISEQHSLMQGAWDCLSSLSIRRTSWHGTTSGARLS